MVYKSQGLLSEILHYMAQHHHTTNNFSNPPTGDQQFYPNYHLAHLPPGLHGQTVEHPPHCWANMGRRSNTCRFHQAHMGTTNTLPRYPVSIWIMAPITLQTITKQESRFSRWSIDCWKKTQGLTCPQC